MMVQIPANFDPAKPCILTAPPSGSRGVYGGIAVGEWGLFQGCAVAYAGKGTGTGFHLLESGLGADTVYGIDGIAGPFADLGKPVQFRVRDLKPLRDFAAGHPFRVATKHAHSQLHPETRWGQFVLQSIEFAFWALNDHFEGAGLPEFSPATTTVIASGVSNGAGASLRALEDDEAGLIDGLVVTEPNINPASAGLFDINFGGEVFSGHGKTLFDDITTMATFAGCAAASNTLAGTPLFGLSPLGAPAGTLANRCTSLAEKGLLAGADLQAQAGSAIQVLRDNGYYAEQDWGIASHEWLNLWRSLQPTYAAAYGRFAVWESVCDVSFAATDGAGLPTPLSATAAQTLFATSSGIPATGGINLIADNAVEGSILENLATSPSTGRKDLNLDGALCFRYFSTGEESLLGDVTKRDRANRQRVALGANQVRTSGNLRGKPALVFHGREDALVFPNSHSRPYFGLNQLVEGAASGLRYIEVTPGQHFDTFLSGLFFSPTAGGQFVPLHFYLTDGLERMMAHLTAGAALPPSQVVQATPRGFTSYVAADAGTRLPFPSAAPGADAITFDGVSKVLTVPRDPS